MAERAAADIYELDPSLDPPVSGKRKKKSKKGRNLRKDKTLTGLTQGGTDEREKKRKSKRVKKKKKGDRAVFPEGNSALDSLIRQINPEEDPTIPLSGSFEHFLQQQEPVSVISDTVKAPKKKKSLRKFPNHRPAKQRRADERSISAANGRETLHLESRPTAMPCHDGTEGGQGGQRQVDDSQGTEDANSEDLFITQKTFLVSSTETSSGGFHVSATPAPKHTKQPRKHKQQQQHQQQKLTTGEPHPLLWGSSTTSEAATQTDNVPPPTDELSTSLKFLQTCRAGQSRCSEKPVDLSLPDRMRAKPDLPSPPSRSQVKEEEVTPPNGPPPRSTDTTSSEDGDAHGRSKADRTQVNAVQMRLNECFFFKVKGGDQSPRPESPLMKFNQSSGKTKTRKKK